MSDASRVRMALPQRGANWDKICNSLDDMKSMDFDWRNGRLPSYTYFWNDDILEKQTEAYTKYAVENGLGAGLAFKSLSTMLTDIFDMGMDLFNAPASAGASFTRGGTESLFEAVKTCRDQARAIRNEPLGHYNIVTAWTAHPTLSKAAEVLDVEVRRTPIDSEFRGTADSYASAIDDRTIMLFTSAPCYSYGVFDRIADISELALKRDLWLHVDGCWGGFLSPFAKQLGYPIPDWDMSLPGVTSLSADLHKFGYAAKGSSLCFYRDAAVQKHEAFLFSDWPHGTYWTPTMGGSTPAGAISSAWAMMQYLAREGYERAAADTMKATMDLINGINAMDGLEVLKPYGESNLFSFRSVDPALDTNAVADLLLERGWMRTRLRKPLAIHQGVTPSHLPVVPEYLAAVQRAVDDVRSTGRKGVHMERTY